MVAWATLFISKQYIAVQFVLLRTGYTTFWQMVDQTLLFFVLTNITMSGDQLRQVK